MLRLSLLALTFTTLLSACAGYLGGPKPAPVVGTPYSNSVGFTGIGGDGF